ncbi:MAG: cytochrome c biogenesis CcdA family protein [Gaiellaceae bacterium]
MNSSSVPFTIALTAGGLAVVNPCAFPLLPAFLSFYLGADEKRLPAASTRALQGLLVGALVATGFLAVFAVVGLPLSLGLSAIADAVPWLGLATGAALACAGLLALAGVSVRLPASIQLRPRARRSSSTAAAMFLFGVGYGAASLGCTLPIFLALVGASLGPAKLTIFAAYAAGMTLVLMALAVSIAFTRQGIARFLRRLLPHISRLAGLLLLASGVYLVYYWYRLRFGNQLTLADDPVVGFASRYSGQLESFAHQHGTPVIAAAAAAVALALILALRQHRRPPARTTGTVPE